MPISNIVTYKNVIVSHPNIVHVTLFINIHD